MSSEQQFLKCALSRQGTELALPPRKTKSNIHSSFSSVFVPTNSMEEISDSLVAKCSTVFIGATFIFTSVFLELCHKKLLPAAPGTESIKAAKLQIH